MAETPFRRRGFNALPPTTQNALSNDDFSDKNGDIDDTTPEEDEEDRRFMIKKANTTLPPTYNSIELWEDLLDKVGQLFPNSANVNSTCANTKQHLKNAFRAIAFLPDDFEFGQYFKSAPNNPYQKKVLKIFRNIIPIKAETRVFKVYIQQAKIIIGQAADKVSPFRTKAANLPSDELGLIGISLCYVLDLIIMCFSDLIFAAAKIATVIRAVLDEPNKYNGKNILGEIARHVGPLAEMFTDFAVNISKELIILDSSIDNIAQSFREKYLKQEPLDTWIERGTLQNLLRSMSDGGITREVHGLLWLYVQQAMATSPNKTREEYEFTYICGLNLQGTNAVSIRGIIGYMTDRPQGQSFANYMVNIYTSSAANSLNVLKSLLPMIDSLTKDGI